MSQTELFDDETPSGFCPAEVSGLDALLEELEAISPNAYDEAVYALLSGLPLRAEVARFARNILDAAKAAGPETQAGRNAAEKAHGDLLDGDTEKVRAAAWKVAREFDRMRGLLRFSAASLCKEGSSEKMYVARCAPDHFVLPLLADHFLARFGETPWAIIDEKRGAVLLRERGKQPVLAQPVSWLAKAAAHTQPVKPAAGDTGGWERLWQTYHKAINNEARANPGLQKQFMPKRYWKYLPETADSGTGGAK